MPADSTTSPRFFFVHIPKCAGTSVLDSLCRAGRRRFVILSESAESKSQALTDLKTEITSRGRDAEKIDLVMGHDVFHGIHQAFEKAHEQTHEQTHKQTCAQQPDSEHRAAAYFTFLRDPTTRYISHYRYLVDASQDRKSPLHAFAKSEVAPEVKLLSLAEYTSRGSHANLMTHYLAAANDPDSSTHRWQIDDRDRLLELATSFLDAMFFIGLVETISDDLRFICQRIGLSEHAKTVNPSKAEVEDQINASLLDQIRTLNDLDLIVYEHAIQLRAVAPQRPIQ